MVECPLLLLQFPFILNKSGILAVDFLKDEIRTTNLASATWKKYCPKCLCTSVNYSPNYEEILPYILIQQHGRSPIYHSYSLLIGAKYLIIS
jgi:hypothetical protein